MRNEAFDDDRYIFEPKWDGWRILLHKQGDRVEAFTRNGRRVRLTDVINPSQSLISTFSVEGNGTALKHMTEQRGWEGIVAKRKDSRYTFDVRSTEWIKVKNWRTIDTVIPGYTAEPHFALVVGLHVPSMHLAVVEYGFTPDEKRAFKRVVGEIQTVKWKGIQWVEPRPCCRIRYLERTDNHHLMMATFEEFLPRKNPDECLWVS